MADKIPLMVVLSFLVDKPEDAPAILTAINPKSLPFFSNQARIIVGTDVADTEKFLDEG